MAEGVEDTRTWNLLAVLGRDTAQGYYISRAMPSEGVLPWLRRWEGSGAGMRAGGEAAA